MSHTDPGLLTLYPVFWDTLSWAVGYFDDKRGNGMQGSGAIKIIYIPTSDAVPGAPVWRLHPAALAQGALLPWQAGGLQAIQGYQTLSYALLSVQVKHRSYHTIKRLPTLGAAWDHVLCVFPSVQQPTSIFIYIKI